VLLLPGLVVKVGVRAIIAVLAMLPHGILDITTHLSEQDHLHHRLLSMERTNATKVVQPYDQIARVCKAIHDEKPVGKESPDVREVQQDVAITTLALRGGYVCLDASDILKPTPRFAFVDGTLETTVARRLCKVTLFVGHVVKINNLWWIGVTGSVFSCSNPPV
jgi:hypothetical protein